MLILRRLIAVLPALAAVLFAVPAQAGVLVASATACDSQSASKPFQPWLDYADYVLAPQGTFEDGADRWRLDRAQLLSDNEAFRVNGTSDERSLLIDAGGQATSAAMCVGVEHPTLRFFARRVGGSALGSLRVDVLFEDELGMVRRVTLGRVYGGEVWQPTNPYPLVVNLLPLLPGERTAVAFAFVAPDASTWAIDDVYVDPYQGR